MAYHPQLLRQFAYASSAVVGNDRSLWSLVDPDATLAQIATAGYITDPATDLMAGDWVFAEGSNGFRQLVVGSIDSAGVVTWTTTLTQNLVQEMVISAGGTMGLTGTRAGSDLGISWQPITGYNSIDQTPRGVTFDQTNGTITIDSDLPGKWNVDFEFSLTFNSTGAARSTQVRLFNVTDGAQVGKALNIDVASQADGLHTVILGRSELTAASLGDALRLEIGNGSTFTGITWTNQQISALYVDRLTALIDPTL